MTMRTDEFVCLAYHELQVPGRGVCKNDAAYGRYVVSVSAFTRQIAALKEAGWRGCSVSEAIEGRERAVALTFDDGTASDFEVAAPVLREAGYSATFYVVASWVNTPGHLGPRELRNLAASGFDIGSHSLSHPNFPDLSPAELRREIRESKDRLEQYVGTPVSHLACPYGGYTRAVLEAALEAGYKSVATSFVGINQRGATVLNRLSVRRTTSLPGFARLVSGQGLLYLRMRQAVLSRVRNTVGFSAYSALCEMAPWRKSQKSA